MSHLTDIYCLIDAVRVRVSGIGRSRNICALTCFQQLYKAQHTMNYSHHTNENDCHLKGKNNVNECSNARHFS